MAEQKPSICRDVVFTHPSTRDRSEKPFKSPGKIIRVNDDESVDVVVWTVTGGTIFKQNVSQGDGEYEWNWPPCV